MTATDGLRRRVRERPRLATAILSILGYALVAAAFTDALPLVPELSREAVIVLGDAIAVVNLAALLTILVGVRAVKAGRIERHRTAMLSAFGLILLFLVLYLVKVGGGFEKAILAEGLVWGAYIVMLAIHILLSALAVPVVLHAVVLGLTHDVSELPDTLHPTVGRVAVAAWSLSLALGIVTYVLLNHVYGWVPR